MGVYAQMTDFTVTRAPDLDATPTDEVRALYQAHAGALRTALRRLAGRADVDDLLQEVFVVALRRAPALMLAESPKAWLYGVAVNVASSSRRNERLRQFFSLDAAPDFPSEASPELDAERRQTATQVHAALHKLSAAKREVLILFELEGLSGQEIAQALGCPLKTVWTRLHHGRRELEARLSTLRDGGRS